MRNKYNVNLEKYKNYSIYVNFFDICNFSAFVNLGSKSLPRTNEFRTPRKYNYYRSQGIAQMREMYRIPFRPQIVWSGK